MVAKKAWIKNLKEGTEGEVRALGKVADKYTGDKYASITIADKSGEIRVKAFGEDARLVEGIENGDFVDVFGVVKEYQGEKYVLPGIVRKVEAEFSVLREAELGLQEGRDVEKGAKEAGTEEEKDYKPEIIRLIGENDNVEGVAYETISSNVGIDNEKLQEAIGELMASGELFEPKYGRYKLI